MSIKWDEKSIQINSVLCEVLVFTFKSFVFFVCCFKKKQINQFKMKMIIIFAALFAAVLAAPVDDSNVAQVLRYENDNVGLEGFKYA